jgi:hypothetical protein
LIVITVNLTGGDAKVSFYMNGRRIPRCYKVQSSSLVATCNFKPNIHGEIRLSVEASPTSSDYTSSTASQVVRVSERTNTR